MTEKKHVVIVGGGPGGYVCAIRLAQKGHRVSLVEAEKVGGTCLNWGCIPSKALIQASELYNRLKQGHDADWGLKVADVALDMQRLQSWKQGVVNQLNHGIEALLSRHQVEMVRGLASFKDENTLKLQFPDGIEEDMQPDYIVLATGSKSINLPALAVTPFESACIVDSRTALDWTEVPKRLLVVGAGVIGLELGQMYARLGSEVIFIEAADALLPAFDPDILPPLLKNLDKQGVLLRLSTKVLSAKVVEGVVEVNIDAPNGFETIFVDKVLVAVGRSPNTDALDLQQGGVEVTPQGHIKVNERLKTTNPAVFAIGDVVQGPQLAHRASKEGLIVADIISGELELRDWKAMPSAIFTVPELASVGLTEKEAKEQGYTLKVGRFPLAASGKALAMGETEGLTKVIADAKTDRVLGVHMVGLNAAERIAEATLAIEMGAVAEDLALTVHAHPTLAETLMEAAEAVHNQAIHIYQKPLVTGHVG